MIRRVVDCCRVCGVVRLKLTSGSLIRLPRVVYCLGIDQVREERNLIDQSDKQQSQDCRIFSYPLVYRDLSRWSEKATEMHGKKILLAAKALASESWHQAWRRPC